MAVFKINQSNKRGKPEGSAKPLKVRRRRTTAPVERKVLNRVDQQALIKEGNKVKKKPVTTWPTIGNLGDGTWPGSPCFHMEQVDYTVHRLIPAKIEPKFPAQAKKLMRSSPRWGVSKRHNRQGRLISPPWAAGQIHLEKRPGRSDTARTYYDVKKGDTKMGNVKIGRGKGNVEINIPGKKDMGYGTEIYKQLRQKHGYRSLNPNYSDLTMYSSRGNLYHVGPEGKAPKKVKLKKEFYYRRLKNGQRQKVRMPKRKR